MDIAAETALAYRAFAAGRHAQAADHAQRVLRQSPADPGALTLIGRLALLSREPDVAHEIFSRVLHKHPQQAALWLDLAAAMRDLNRHAEAAAAVERAIGLAQDNSAAWLRLGEVCLTLNDRARAADAFRRALRLDPDGAAAWRGLCQAEDVDPDSEAAQRMEALSCSSTLKAREAAELHYALAQVYRRAGGGQEFIRHLFAANAQQRTLCADGRAAYELVFDRLDAAFPKESFAKATRADPVSPTPLFILGMPRSGTTLVERLLAAHPDVSAGGELDYMRGPLRRSVERATGYTFPQGFETLSAQELNSLARPFARRLALIGQKVNQGASPGAAADAAGATRYVTDKTPGNFHLLGLLGVLFPAGRIVHVARDPMDTCFSILQYPFDDRSPHTCDVQLLAYVYARYLRLMRRWRDLLGDEFITVEYERLVESPGEEAARLFEYCGLVWSDSYLEFHRSDAAVRTFSAAQVRRPIYKSSIGGWREFSEALDPLRRALESELRRADLA